METRNLLLILISEAAKIILRNFLKTSVTMAGFDVEAFLGKKGLSVREQTGLKKVDLTAIADHLNLDIPKQAKKDDLLTSHLNVDQNPKKNPLLSLQKFEVEKMRLQLEFEMKKEELPLKREREEKELALKRERERKELALKREELEH